MPKSSLSKAGADAARAYDDAFRQIIANDPDVQAEIRRVWGDTPLNARPSDTPKELEKANAQASKNITAILKRKGIDLPERTFVNPRTGSIEGHRGWSGLNGVQKAAIIAAVAATGVGAAALAAGGGAAAAGGAAAGSAGSGAGAGAGAGIGVTTGLGGLGTIGTTVPVGTAAGTSLGTGALTSAAVNAAKTKLQGGSWKDAAISAGTGALTGGAGMGSWADIAKSLAKDPDTYKAIGSTVAGMGRAAAENRGEQTAINMNRDRIGLQARANFNDAELQRAKLMMEQQAQQREAETLAYRNALKSALAMNMTDASFDRPQGIPVLRFNGGARPSAIGQQGRDAAGLMNNIAMRRLMEPEKTYEMSPLEEFQQSDVPEAGFWEKIAGPVSLGATAIGEYGARRGKMPIVTDVTEEEARRVAGGR